MVPFDMMRFSSSCSLFVTDKHRALVNQGLELKSVWYNLHVVLGGPLRIILVENLSIWPGFTQE